jgi:hypothetical protein
MSSNQKQLPETVLKNAHKTWKQHPQRRETTRKLWKSTLKLLK